MWGEQLHKILSILLLKAGKDLVTLFPVIRDWMEEFILGNKHLVASDIGHNMFIAEVNFYKLRYQMIWKFWNIKTSLPIYKYIIFYCFNQVMRLLAYLVKFGYYENFSEFEKLLGPIIEMSDGRNDLPFHTGEDQFGVV